MPNRYLSFGKNLSKNEQERYLNSSVFKDSLLEIAFHLCKQDITQPLKCIFSKDWEINRKIRVIPRYRDSRFPPAN